MTTILNPQSNGIFPFRDERTRNLKDSKCFSPNLAAPKDGSWNSSLVHMAQNLLLFLYSTEPHTLGLRARFPKVCSVKPWAPEMSPGVGVGVFLVPGHILNRISFTAEHFRALARRELTGVLQIAEFL